MSGLLRGTAIFFTTITVVLWGDLVISVAAPQWWLELPDDQGIDRWVVLSCVVAMLVGVILTGVGTVQSLRRGRPDGEATQPHAVASRLYRIALYFFVVSSLIFVSHDVASRLDPDGFGSDANVGAGVILLLALLGLLVGSILAVIASYQWATRPRSARAR